MKKTPLYIGLNKVVSSTEAGTGEFVKINGETFYKIQGYNTMSTFFMTVVSSTDQWMFLASNGSLSAGRKNPESALFPYYTDDKIIDSGEVTGSKSIIKVYKDGKCYLWEPFTERYIGVYRVERNIFKNKTGTKVLFEEINLDLNLTFSYSWGFSDKYGFVKSSEISNQNTQNIELEVLDGLRNILPYGVNLDLQTSRSTLVDAYKKNELDKATGLGIFSLSSMIVDKAEPSEALQATSVWSTGLNQPKHLLSTSQLGSYRKGEDLVSEEFEKANKAAYFIHSKFNLTPSESKKWIIVSEVNQSNADIVNLKSELESNKTIYKDVLADMELGTLNLKRLVALADGLQSGNDQLTTSRHFSNVLFNLMRGGIFENEYSVDTNDFSNYLKIINKNIYDQNQSFLNELGQKISYQNLLKKAKQDSNLHRICLEYLPLSFSRRHGDPSRPWNYFNIDLNNANGNKKFNYEGNWRDIFQNWEALAFSFPDYIMGMITKFVNASTIDGYNPYRISREGIDWEVIEPHDPWSYIGYWGDHQIIYLQKLLEHAENHFPGALHKILNQADFVYANVPYRIKGYDAILKNPNDTIDFDTELSESIHQKTQKIGADGKLIWVDDALLKATFAEKILVMALTKLYNFVPDGGIWLNTQRPEWNDANNALVGNGLSVVTLNYLRRFLVFASDLFSQKEQEFELHKAPAKLLRSLSQTFGAARQEKSLQFTPKSRKEFLDQLGTAGEEFRTAGYQSFSQGTTQVQSSEVINLIDHALVLVEDTLKKSKRPDGLYHAYNLLQIDGDKATVSNLYEMLEGQVAAMSSGLLEPVEALNLLNTLKKSKMYRKDQYSYMLYPNRELKPFIQKNEIPQSLITSSKLLAKLISENDKSLFEQDKNGGCHFAGEIKNEADIQIALDNLRQSDKWGPLVEKEEGMILEAFEEVFDHLSFTGRSGTFYGYEGLGSIYWHMVSKLLLATQETILSANSKGAEEAIIGSLKEHYYEIRAGIGINKSPKLYGAFPTDAYSHTPSNAGAQQPGMTGQVKEDIINRWAELGIEIKAGQIHFNPIILDPNELLPNEGTFEYLTNSGEFKEVKLRKGELAFTYCGVLFKYHNSKNKNIEVLLNNGTHFTNNKLMIDEKYSQLIFNRSSEIQEVNVHFPVTNR